MRADLIERLRKAADNFEACREWHANAEDSDCEPHQSSQIEMADASKAALEAADALASQEPEAIKPLEWSEARIPSETCPYNHVVARHPFGDFLITWKAWKDYPSYCVDLPWSISVPDPEYPCENSLDAAKSIALSELKRYISSAFASPVVPVAAKAEAEGATLRICPMRDAVCPWGMSCPFVGDGYHGYPCKEGWRNRPAPTGKGDGQP